MSQSLGERTELLGTLTCLSPVHIGGWDSTVEASLTIARDGNGQPCLPGTSIAGALRAYLATLDRFRGDRGSSLKALFGHVVDRSQDGSPSWLRVDDAHLIGTQARLSVRDGVGIDRRSASAAANFLYTRQVLPVGTRFALRLVADTPTEAAEVKYPGGWPALVHDAVEDIVAGLTLAWVPFGAGRGHGFGTVALSDVAIRRTDLSDPAGLIAWLTGAPPAVPAAEAENPERGPDGRLTITVAWRPVSPFLVRDSLPGTVVDTLPLTDTDADGRVRLLLPGSSIRGALRAHAERIVRTLCREYTLVGFDESLRQPPPGVDVLFGRAPSSRGDGDTGRRGALTAADCHSVGQVTTREWDEILTTRPDGAPAPPGERAARQQRNTERAAARSGLRDALARIDDRIPVAVNDHVAIDRWTGGASDHRLFSVLAPTTTVVWEPIRIGVDVAWLNRYATANGTLALPLLLLVLRDLQDGWLSLGYGGTRGYGQIEVTDVTFIGNGLVAPWSSLAGRTLDSVIADPPPDIAEATAIWANRIQQEEAA